MKNVFTLRQAMFAAAFLVAGCATGIVHIFPLVPLAEETKAARIAIQPASDVTRRTDPAGFGTSGRYQSGAVFSEVFIGTDPTGPRLEVLSATAQDKITDLGFTGEFIYRISAVLHVGGKSHPIKGEGVVRAHGLKFPTTYAQLACEKACVDVATQAKKFLP